MPPATDEPLLTLPEAAKLFPRDGAGRPVHPKTLARWARRGVRASDGRMVKFPVVSIGHRTAVRPAAVRSFVDELNRSPEPAGAAGSA